MGGYFCTSHNWAFFLDSYLTAQSFLELLQNQIGPAIEEVAPANHEIWFQMDGCPAHNSREGKQYVDEA